MLRLFNRRSVPSHGGVSVLELRYFMAAETLLPHDGKTATTRLKRVCDSRVMPSQYLCTSEKELPCRRNGTAVCADGQSR